MAVDRRGGNDSFDGLGTSIAHITLQGVQRTISPRQVSPNPPGKYYFSFTPFRLIVAVLVQNTKSILSNNRKMQNNKTKRFINYLGGL